MKVIFLLAPVFVSFFWAIALMGDKLKYSIPRLFLSKFMFLTGLIFSFHFLYFAPYPNLYVYTDVLLQWLGLIIFPLYHIYFRLLTVDEKFSIKLHFRYLLIPSIVALAYAAGVLNTPLSDYKTLLINPHNNLPPASIWFLLKMRIVLHITYILGLIISLYGNLWLIRKYGNKAQQYYSDIEDTSLKNVKNINYVIIALSITSITASSIGRFTSIVKMDWFIYIGWTLFSVLLFMIGNSGIKQKMINPSYEASNGAEETVDALETYVGETNLLLKKIMVEFTNNKIYLNSNLNINDLTKIVGSNRSYLSAVINKQFNQNFCSFVNDFRLEELERIMVENPDYGNNELADHSGFGSVNSMKRAIYSRSGLSMFDYKIQVYKK